MDLKIVKVLILLFVFSIVFLAIESKSSSSYGYKKMMSIITNSNRQLTSLGVVRKSSSIATSYIPSSISSPSKKPTRAAYRAPRISNVGDNGDRPFSTHYPSQYIHASFFSTTPLFALNDATRSKAQEISESVTVGANYLPLNAQHWFTQLLPEGWCVGVSNDTSVCDSSLHSTIFLHPDEYQWGVDNIASESSRTSYYLGRMALRLSLDALLQSESMDMDAQEKLKFCTQLKDEIHSIAINKDSYGRPILPGIISGSISHKGGNAVGLARFRSLGDNQHALDNNHFEMMYTSTIKWREECPIYEDDDTYKDATDGISYMSNAVSGIGIDLERIDARRGKRIKRKVLTETEQAELGGLEDIGISSDEEVVLRFSLKESVYKALHPILCQYVGFQEAEITPLADGTAKVTLNLLRGSHDWLGIVVNTASWRKTGHYFLTSASVGLVPGKS